MISNFDQTILSAAAFITNQPFLIVCNIPKRKSLPTSLSRGWERFFPFSTIPLTE
ncbi:hypothetical protein KsCSTR_36680 [Candidatus Kuenenia stuttgartiensis]|uniref:Uncharacterized protein n=1 Tax=Kuenenia stuttgartiensis TaxID=174633 RepID=Q1Q6E4_KUEST|nr:hypothetical protein KsCSTR_36680 [Candidatus Kuenenia stuttgartiensis]CAJ73150.1 unknown protein [Candidatus Kuenenia stuttgartiensis]